MSVHDILSPLTGEISQVFPSLDSTPQLSESESRASEDAEDDELIDISDTQVDLGIDTRAPGWDGERNGGWDEAADPGLSETEITLLSHRQALDDGWGPGIIYSPRPVKEPLTWTSPLPEISSVAEADVIKIGGESFEFLSRFLADKRQSGIPFEQSHGLVNFLLRAVTACAFDTMQRWAPKDLILMQVQGPDQLELQWWLRLLSDISYTCPKPAETAGTDWDLLSASISDWAVGQVRHMAVHRLSYSTKLVRDSVNFLIALNDLERFRQVERTVRALYGTLSGAFVVDDDETSALTSTLQLYPTECRTALDLFYTIGGILENTYYRNSEINHKDWLVAHKVTVAEHLELYRPEGLAWTSIYRRDDDVSNLRNNVAHRDGYISRVTFDRERIRQVVQDLIETALSLDDEAAAAQIAQVSEAAMMQLQARSDAYEASLDALSAQDLRAMSREAQERFDKWDPTRFNPDRDIFKHTIAYRYRTASETFSNLADLKDGTTYRRKLWCLQWKIDEAHEGWQMAQRNRFEDAKTLLT